MKDRCKTVFVRLLTSAFFFMLAGTGQARDYSYEEFITFYGADGTALRANVFTPNTGNGEQFPAIIFINSWAFEEHEYIVQAKKFAEKGYVVLSYSARGWGFSGGLVDVAGPNDMKDFSAAVDWLINNKPIDPKRIGAAGISYGAGMAMMGAMTDGRISAIAAMSGWANLQEALNGNNTPDKVWGSLLVGSGYLTGRMDPIIAENFIKILTHTDIKSVNEWAAPRSPDQHIKRFNQLKIPTYISNNLRDELFEPNAMLAFFEQLKGPKKLDLNLGNHTTAELAGLVGITNYVWDNVHNWFDYYLQHQTTIPVNETLVSMAIKFSDQRDDFREWPSKSIKMRTWQLSPRRMFSPGKLITGNNTLRANNDVYSGRFSGASAGIPVIGSVLEAHVNVPIFANMAMLNPMLAVSYQSPVLNETQKLRGVAELDLWIKPSGSKAQVIAYLYDVGSNGFGRLISHGPVTLHDAKAHALTQVHIPLYVTAYDIPAGHRLALVIDTQDAQYAQPGLAPYKVTIPFSRQLQSRLTLPIAQ